MLYERIEVISRDEYQGGQEPKAFQWRGELFAIERVVDRWHEGYVDARRMPLRYYKVETGGGRQFILRYHELFRAWGLRVPEEEQRD